MKTLLLASAMALAVAAPSFAQSVSSSAGVAGVQGTYSNATAFKGSVLVGTVAGNYTDVSSNARATGGNKPSANSNVTQTNIGGTISGGTANGKATGSTGGAQSSVVLGSAKASALNFGNNNNNHNHH